MMMISGKQLHFDSMYKCHQVQTSYPSDAYTTGVAEDKIVLPPRNINPSNKGVPVLWTNTNDEYGELKSKFILTTDHKLFLKVKSEIGGTNLIVHRDITSYRPNSSSVDSTLMLSPHVNG